VTVGEKCEKEYRPPSFVAEGPDYLVCAEIVRLQMFDGRGFRRIV